MGVYVRRFLAYGRAVVYNSLRFSSCTDEGRANHVAILPPALHPHPAAVFHIHDTLQHFADVVGANRRSDLAQRPVADIPELPDAGRTPVVHVPLDQHLPVHPYRLALVEQGDGPKKNVSLSGCSCCRPACRT